MSVDQLDIATLDHYLARHVEGFSGLQAAEKFPGGQSNPTFLLRAYSGKYVLRRKPPGELLKSAHAVDREFRIITALANSNVPVAKAYHLCEDDDVIGSMFYIMSYVEGRIFWDPALPELDNADRTAIYDDMNRVLTELHTVDIDAAGLGDYGKPGNYFERQIGRWTTQYLAAESETIEPMDELMRWLPEHMPADDGKIALVHGDYRLDNLIFHPTEPRILAVVDWELSTLGHPYADLAYQSMQWRLPSTGISKGLANFDRNALGIPTEAEYVGAYCRRMGYGDIADWRFYLAFSYFRLASIVQGVLKRAIDGNASNTLAMQIGRMARPLAQAAIDLIDEANQAPADAI